MIIKNDYPGASIDIKKLSNNRVDLELKKENNQFSFYFNFTCLNVDDQLIIKINNIREAMYSKGYLNYCPFYKVNDGAWKKFSVKDISLTEKSLEIKVKKVKKIEISSTPRYTLKNLMEFLSKISEDKNITVKNYGNFYEIFVGNSSKTYVFIARQHPGETFSSFFIEGVLEQLLLEKNLNYNFIIYPIVNVDGVENGNHRFLNNIDYSRSWSLVSKPKEIDLILKQIKKYNVCGLFDIHGDEVTKFDYIRTDSKTYDFNKIGLKTLAFESKLKKIIKAVVDKRNIKKALLHNTKKVVEKAIMGHYYLYELSHHINNVETANEKGRKIVVFLNRS